MKKLFSTSKIGNLELKNRLVALPVFTGYALPDARVSPLLLEHYRRLGASGAAMVVVPNIAVTAGGLTSDRSLMLDDDKQIPAFSRLAQAIKEGGALAALQLNHAGRYAVTNHPLLPSSLNTAEIAKNIATLKNFMESFPFEKRFGLTAHVARMSAGWTRQMSDVDIENTITAFGEAAVRAYQAGFDLIELHGATGYLITQFLSASTNRRPAPWGGPSENRMRFALRIVEEIKKRIPESVPVGFRLLMDEMTRDGISVLEATSLAEELERRGVAYLSATLGAYQSMFTPDVAKHLARPGYLADQTQKLKTRVNIPVIISGRIVAPKLAEKILQNQEADLIGLGRPLIADPDWIKKTSNSSSIIACKNCNTCFRNVALGESLICERWPQVKQDRIRLETRFASRHAFRVLSVLSSLADLEIGRQHVRDRVPIHKEVHDRQLFINTGQDPGFEKAARKYAAWCDQYLREHLGRGGMETVFMDADRDPVEMVMDHLKDNFGILSIPYDKKTKWKDHLVLKAPPDMVVFRSARHPNPVKVMVPVDLSIFTLMQIRVALHVFAGRTNVEYHFVHVAQNPDEASEKWKSIIRNFEIDPSTDLHLISLAKGLNTAETLIEFAESGQYGSLIIGRRGGLARVRRRILGSVSQLLLEQLPGCNFVIVG